MVKQSQTAQGSRSRMLVFQISMTAQMVEEIESIAREESLAQKKRVSRSSKIRDLCCESLDRRRKKI
jgi:metal-responsive CopG/Arc/MetJ family transcriptional regulator